MTEKYIGLCASAGGVITGFDLILGEIRKNRAKFVLIASDSSERTKKQLTDKCKYYNVKYYIINEYSSEAIAHMLEKRALCGAAAFTGRGPWKNVLEELDSRERESTESDEVKTLADNADT